MFAPGRCLGRSRARRRATSAVLHACLALGVACTGAIKPANPDESSGGPSGGAPEGPGGSGAPGTGDPKGGEPARPSGPPPAAAPATGQRLTDRQYLNILEDVFGFDASADAATLPLDPKIEGFRNAAAGLLPSDLRIEGYATVAATVAGKIDIAKVAGCATLGDQCQRDFITRLGRRLFRRPLDDAQIARFNRLFAVVAEAGDSFAAGARLVITAMLQSPEFLYRIETDAAPDDHAVATRLAFLIWNSTPDEALLDAAAKGDLKTAAGVRTATTRLIADARARRALRDYVDDWLDAERLLRTSRDPVEYPDWTGALASEMRDEIHQLFARVVWQDNADLLEVLRAERTTVTPALAKLYGLPAGDGPREQSLAEMPARVGLLTQAGVLTLTSVGGHGSSIVDRGVFLVRNLLCVHMPEPPLNVPELAAPENGASERDRLAQHRADPACGSCHNHIDPLGLAFETFDAIGRYQARDQHGNALTGAGTLDLGGNKTEYKNVREFVAALARAPEVSSCLVKKLAQYTLARPLTNLDDPLLADLGRRFDEQGRRYPALLNLLAESAVLRSKGVAP